MRSDHQDFLMINQERAPGGDSRGFIDFVEAGHLSALLHVFKAHGLGGGLARLKTLAGMVGRRFSGFATEPFNTVSPHCCGPHAVVSA